MLRRSPCYAPGYRRRTGGLVRTGRTAPNTRPAGVEAISRAFLLAGLIAAGLLTAAPATAIVGGNPTDPNEYKWQVAVDIPDVGDVTLCGGTLIARGWAMTAAHCVYDSDNSRFVDPSRVRVRVGSRVRASGGEVIGVSRIRAHPNYDSDEDVYDVALLELAASAPENLGAVGFPDAATHNRIAPIGTRATALGWGVTNPDECLSVGTGCFFRYPEESGPAAAIRALSPLRRRRQPRRVLRRGRGRQGYLQQRQWRTPGRAGRWHLVADRYHQLR